MVRHFTVLASYDNNNNQLSIAVKLTAKVIGTFYCSLYVSLIHNNIHKRMINIEAIDLTFI